MTLFVYSAVSSPLLEKKRPTPPPKENSDDSRGYYTPPLPSPPLPIEDAVLTSPPRTPEIHTPRTPSPLEISPEPAPEPSAQKAPPPQKALNPKPLLPELLRAAAAFQRHKEAADKRLAAQRKTSKIEEPISRTILRTVNYRDRRIQRRRRAVSRRSFFCEICKVPCPGPRQYGEHLRSRRHIRRANPVDYNCKVCNRIFFSEEDYNKHIAGKKHRNALQFK